MLFGPATYTQVLTSCTHLGGKKERKGAT